MTTFYNSIAPYYDLVFPAQQAQVTFAAEVFEGKKLILDAGCATGSLLLELAEKGHQVHGFDLDEQMIRLARQKASAAGIEATFEVGDLLAMGPSWPLGRFNGVICAGNTLVHLAPEDVAKAFDGFAGKIPKGGRLVVQILNYDRILEDEVDTLPPIDTDRVTFTRTYDLSPLPGHLDFHTELYVKDEDRRIQNTVPLYPLRCHDLVQAGHAAGFRERAVYGSFRKDPYSETSYACILVAEKA